MPNPWFRFKQFTVWHDKCAMKVGTDGVLLGAWANIGDARTVLDVGSGSGLIALLIAQRFPLTNVTAIDIDESAAIQSGENFARSPWSERLTALHCPLDEFAQNHSAIFDAIITNPPFFQQSLHSPDKKRTTARHTAELSSESLLKGAAHLLSAEGSIHLILPVTEGNEFINIASDYGLFCHRKTTVYPTNGSLPKRLLIALKKTADAMLEDSLTIETANRHQFSEEYIRLTRDFYLKM